MFSMFEFTLHSAFAVFLLLLDRWSTRIQRLIGVGTPPNYGERVDLSGNVVVITGANIGIGRATATQLVACGATVVLGCRDIQKGIEAAQLINKMGGQTFASKGKAIFMRLDLADLTSVVEFASKVKVEFPRVDILINNAGLNTAGILPSGVEQLFQVNYLGHYLLVRCLESALCAKGLEGDEKIPMVGRVINLSSVTHHTGQPDFVASSTGAFTFAMKRRYSYYADSKMYMNYLTMEINRRLDFAKTYSLATGPNSFSSFDNENGKGTLAADVRPVVAFSVNPGAVRSDIWRNYPFQRLYKMIMKLVFLEVEEGCASSVFAATLGIDALRAYQTNLAGTKDIGGRFVMRPDVPYVIPYVVKCNCLAQEILGVYHGCKFGGVSLPTEQEVHSQGEALKRQPSYQARNLWTYSAQLCAKVFASVGTSENDFKFLLKQ